MMTLVVQLVTVATVGDSGGDSGGDSDTCAGIKIDTVDAFFPVAPNEKYQLL
jgi:hypothetical protein